MGKTNQLHPNACMDFSSYSFYSSLHYDSLLHVEQCMHVFLLYLALISCTGHPAFEKTEGPNNSVLF